MEILKMLFKVFAWLMIVIALMIPAFFGVVYFFSNCDKEIFMNILNQIPADRFFLYPLMILLTSLYLMVYALKRMYAAGYGDDNQVDHKKVEEIKDLVMSGDLNKK